MLAVGSQAAQIALIWVTGRDVIDGALEQHDTHRLWLYVGAIAALGLVSAVLMLGRRLISGKQALDVEMDMRQGLYSHLVRLSFGFYDRHQTGQLMSRATVDLQGVRFFLGYGLIFFFQNILTVVSVSIVLFFFEWRLALDRARDDAVPRRARLPLQPRRAPDAARGAAEARGRRNRGRGEHRRRPRREGVRPGAGGGGEVRAAATRPSSRRRSARTGSARPMCRCSRSCR